VFAVALRLVRFSFSICYLCGCKRLVRFLDFASIARKVTVNHSVYCFCLLVGLFCAPLPRRVTSHLVSIFASPSFLTYRYEKHHSVVSGKAKEVQGPSTLPYIPGGDCCGIIKELPDNYHDTKQPHGTPTFHIGD
jgi:hypothetical protein